MIKEGNFSNIELTIKAPKAFYYDYQDVIFEDIKLISENISMLGLYLSYLELNGIDYKIKCRPNNKFYINKCFVHRSLGEDYPISIIDNKGLFVCRGCNQGGHIIDFIGEAYRLQPAEILKILFSYINGTYEELSEKEKITYDRIFYRYDLKDKYISISKEKTQKLNNKIKRYLENTKKEIDCFEISKRLGCSSEYIRRFIEIQKKQELERTETKIEMNKFKSFQELISTPVSESENSQIIQMIEKIYNTSFNNQVWIEAILDYLNDNKTEKQYEEYYLTPDFSWNTRKYTYRFISTEEDMPSSITDSDVQVLKKFKAQTPFILYDYEEKTSGDIFAYLEQPRTLKKVLEAIGMSEELKEYLCEYCFYRINQTTQQERPNGLVLTKKQPPF